jgi:DNA-binding transcriptional LysR family regulator
MRALARCSHPSGLLPPAISVSRNRRHPHAKLRGVSADYLAATDGLSSGDIDVAFAPEQAVLPGMRSQRVFEESAALVVRRDHPQVGRRITRKLFNQLPHIDVHVALGRLGAGHRVAQRGWERAGVQRRIVLTVPYFMTAALAAAATDCMAGLPDRMAALCVSLFPLKQVAAAFPLPSMTTLMFWHQRTETDPGACAFRNVVAGAVTVPRLGPTS